MRRLALPLVAAATLASVPAAHGVAGRPALRVTQRQPVTVVGAQFRPHEHVRVVVRTRRSYARETDASAAGSFRIRFPRVRLGVCTPYSARATGNRGSRAVAKPTLELCGAPPAPIG